MFTKNATLLAVLLLTSAVAAPSLANCSQHNNPASATTDQTSVFKGLVEDYLAIQTALAGDTIEGVVIHAQAIEKLAIAAAELSRAENIDAARKSFAALSNAMITYRELVPGDKPQVAYCSMAKQSWLQDGNKIANPYFGSAMLRCGTIVEK